MLLLLFPDRINIRFRSKMKVNAGVCREESSCSKKKAGMGVYSLLFPREVYFS